MTQAGIFTFETQRMTVSSWRQEGENLTDLVTGISRIVTENVLKTLPPNWAQLTSHDAIEAWITDREQEGLCLGVYHKQEKKMFGLLFLTDPTAEHSNNEIRLGYLFAEAYWGLGYATELIKGLKAFCEAHFTGIAIVGGVEPSNIGSVKALTKNGFLARPDISNENTVFYAYVCP